MAKQGRLEAIVSIIAAFGEVMAFSLGLQRLLTGALNALDFLSFVFTVWQFVDRLGTSQWFESFAVVSPNSISFFPFRIAALEHFNVGVIERFGFDRGFDAQRAFHAAAVKD